MNLPDWMGAALGRLAGRRVPDAAPGNAPAVPSRGEARPGRVRRAVFAVVAALFSLGLALVMLYAKFPDERLRVWIERTLSPGRGVSLAVREVRTTLFPPGAELSGLRLRLDGASEVLADMPEAAARLDLGAALLGRLEVRARGTTLGGELTLSASSDSLFGDGWSRVEVAASRVDLGRSPGLSWLFNRHVGGRLSGQLEWSPGKADSGRAGLLLEDAFIEVEGEMLRAVRVELGRMAIRAAVRDGGLFVSECSVASAMLRGDLAGRIAPAEDIRASQVDFAGTLTDEVQAEVTPPKPAKVRLTGALASPTISWENRPDGPGPNGAAPGKTSGPPGASGPP
jgi:type II secretion system protein N